MAAIRAVQHRGRPELDFIALAIQGKKIGFEKVIGMIDEMVVTLKTEQNDDEHKKEYCAKQFDLSDDHWHLVSEPSLLVVSGRFFGYGVFITDMSPYAI